MSGEERLKKGEHLEFLNLQDLNLAGLNFEGKRFCASDVRGVTFSVQIDQEDGTQGIELANLRGTDWTDAIFADFGEGVYFGHSNAEGARFGYTEDLIFRPRSLQISP